MFNKAFVCEDLAIVSLLHHEVGQDPSLVIRNMLHVATSLVVDSEESFKRVSALYRQARDWKRRVDNERKDRTEPLRKETSAINAEAKRLTDPLDQIIDVTNVKAAAYQKQVDEAKRQEDQELKAMAEMLGIEPQVAFPKPSTSIAGEGARTVTKTVKRFKVTDLAKVPARFLMVDEDKLQRAIDDGVQTIPGIEVYEETRTHLRVG